MNQKNKYCYANTPQIDLCNQHNSYKNCHQKHEKTSAASLVIREIQIKATTKYSSQSL